jgi:hypothetical protein
MKEFMDYDINDITVRVEYYFEKGSEGTRDVPPTPDTLEVDSYHWQGMDVTQLVNAWASFEVRNIEEELLEKLGISNQCLYLGFQALKYLGFIIQRQDHHLQIIWDSRYDQKSADNVINQFLAAVREEQFQQDYFFHVPLSIIIAMIGE